MADVEDLPGLLVAIAVGDDRLVRSSLEAAPSLATARLSRQDEFFIPERHAQLYEGDTALHAAAFTYDVDVARELLAHGADIRAKNRRGAEPLHAATIGAPDSTTWDPARQRAIIKFLIAAGADPNAPALGGVTPLHRAVRNRCSPAVAQLLQAGADPGLPNNNGSTPTDLAHHPTGRGGSGSEAAKAEQQLILTLLAEATN
ncbi:ankyrin repeat domain-containing protein [Kribbella sp. NBC_00709]|uniref:ankyrin repeat domain-containing protein n=1 Tax=Kribbella sp. NBC_00709 TaxID=2975972 RepID=UPI002E2A93FF|nr:ankyrin repeat domain-containing protein [Kribbella sp. NBC_00709]